MPTLAETLAAEAAAVQSAKAAVAASLMAECCAAYDADPDAARAAVVAELITAATDAAGRGEVEIVANLERDGLPKASRERDTEAISTRLADDGFTVSGYPGLPNSIIIRWK